MGDLASTVLAYHYTNNENPENDKFLNNALDRFNNGENAEAIVYSLDGQVVNRNGETNHLPNGIYVKNGKKFIVK